MKYLALLFLISVLYACSTNEEITKTSSEKTNYINIKKSDTLSVGGKSLLHEATEHK